MDLELPKLMKLKNLELKLTALLKNIDKEINQTSIEWMHLRAIVEENYGSTQVDQNVDIQKTNLIQLQKQIDDDSNTTELDLTINELCNEEEEEELN
ncbi:hypothetical protein GWI33_022253 [Rhynchophorus ferrugineus]|uniref:Uncharacterized protein n=1 Tax=Rhynchophorus ferrugineus TaxID=354439 RepID=A0A834IQT1_RHYFE|nr:hypothetical protein GWI33_022253 [Rhynchophorus ferrugineus]